MSGIALYDVLRKIEGVSPDEAKEAVAELASTREVATKADLERMARVLIMWVVGVGIAVIGIIKYL